jgi:alkaline phosphatase D
VILPRVSSFASTSVTTASNVSPAGGYQFFGEVDIDGHSGELTVRLREQDGTVLFTRVLQPGRVGQ